MKKQTRTGPALTWRTVSLILALWFICMIILTLCVASDMRIQVAQKLDVFVENGSRRYASDDSELPGFAETQMITYLGSPYIWLNLDQLLPIVRDQNFDGSISSSDWMWGKWHFYYGYEPAVIYYDENGEEMIRTGHYLTFDYTTPENWNQRNFDPTGFKRREGRHRVNVGSSNSDNIASCLLKANYLTVGGFKVMGVGICH